MSSEPALQAKALRAASELGCSGAHVGEHGEWMPCSSFTEYKDAMMRKAGVSRITQDDIENWNSRRKKKGKKRRSGFQKLRERGVLGIDTLPSGGLVSAPIATASIESRGMSVKAIQAPYSPRDEDMDVFTDIESARKRSRQMGCIGVSRRVSKSGKLVWMPCTNMSDYDRLAGTTPLGRRHQQQAFTRAVRTVLKDSSRTRKKSLAEELHDYKGLGRTLRNVSARFDPKAEDGDGDGILQDNTPFQRPAVTGKIQKAVGVIAGKKQRRAPAEEWYHSMSEQEREDRFGPSIDAIAELSPKERASIARSMSKPAGLRSSTTPPTDNPKATKANPYAELGGRAMGRIILGRVRPEHRNKPGQKTTYFIGGTVGSGKGTVVEKHLQANGLIPNDDEAAHVDPDFVKLGIPGFNDGRGIEAVHNTSRVATDKIIKDAVSEGMDVIVQGTGRRTEHLRGAKRSGYRTVGHFVYASDDVAERRATRRAQTSTQQTPVRLARKMAGIIPYSISEAFGEGLMDEFYLWDNDSDDGVPKLIARKVPGKAMEIFDRPKFEDFAKGKSRADQWEKDANGRDKQLSGVASKKG